MRAARKQFGSKVALDGIDVTFGPGVIGLVGPNSSGKTTLLRTPATTLAPSAGQILWNGVDAARKPDPLRRDLLYVPQNFTSYPNLSAQEFLEYLARLRGVGSADARGAATGALGAVGLGEDRKGRLGAFTPGMISDGGGRDPAQVIRRDCGEDRRFAIAALGDGNMNARPASVPGKRREICALSAVQPETPESSGGG